MQVTVIIPVYQAERFIVAAVESALAQPETAEVLLIEDGSKDKSLAICQKLTSDARIKLLTHPDGKNMGASASRNLGIRNASMPFIAFLDSDDTYLPGRFDVTKTIFAKHGDADGVHEIIGAHYHDPAFRERHIVQASGENTGIRVSTKPEDLFRILATGKYGHISLDGLVMKKSALDQIALLDTNMVMSEDSDFILRLAATRRFYGGDPSRIIALRGVHGQNSVFVNPRVMYYRRKYLQKCIDHHFYGSTDLIAQLYIITRRVGAGKLYAPFRRLGKFALPVKLVAIAGYLLIRPALLLNLTKLALRGIVKSTSS